VTGCAPGTVDFHYDVQSDIVFARTRWKIESSAQAMSWYELHARYLGARFSRSKDLVAIHDSFEVSLSVVSLWQRYSARLHESRVRVSAVVSSKPWSRVALATRGVQPIVSATVVDAVAAILACRRQPTNAKALSLTA